jgi:beta-xylosidase
MIISTWYMSVDCISNVAALIYPSYRLPIIPSLSIMNRITSLLVLTAISKTNAALSGTSQNSTYYNPILPGWHSDPSCIHVNETYYCATSTFQSFPGLPIYASKDLINWKHISNAWNREEQLPGINLQSPQQQAGMFAPNLRYHDGLFHMTCVYAGVNTTSEINGTIFTTADPYSDSAWSIPFVWEAPERTIDPDLFFDDDGKTYLTWSGIGQQTIDLARGELSEIKSIWNGSSGTFTEGPHIYKKDGYYYLLAAEGGTQLGHMATIARSENIDGPYESNPANPILTNTNTTKLFQTVGHADLFQDAKGEWWGVALSTRSGPEYKAFPMGREASLFPVTWRKGEWPFASQVRGEMSGWPLPAFDRDVPGEGAFVTDNDIIDFAPGTDLPLHFMHFRYPAEGAFTISPSDHPNTLQIVPSTANLTGVQSSSDPDLNGQSGLGFVGHRQTDSLFTFSVDLTFRPKKAGYEAGATMFFTQWQHIDVGVLYNNPANETSAGGGRSESCFTLHLRSTNATSTILHNRPLPVTWQTSPTDAVRFAISTVNVTHYRFAAAPTNNLNELVVMGDVPASLVSSTWGEQAGSGAAVTVGVYATGNGERDGREDGSDDNAYFSRWRYEGRGQEVDFGVFI